jgi:hypothetical protein
VAGVDADVSQESRHEFDANGRPEGVG